MDIGAWLRALELERYEQVFRDNDVDGDLLLDLTEADLEKLGVASLGHRKMLLRAIEALRPPGVGLAAGATAVADEASLAPPPPASRSQAERRQLTVMFVDLVDSTALSAALDPEDMGEVIRGYQNAVAGEIARFEGHVAKFMGDGVLAYFGWPRAHEDEAERAVRTGLAATRAVGDLRTPEGQPLAARIGIATGLVVVGDLVGEGASQEEAVVGETPNLAARLQALAEPGQVVIAEATRRLIGGGFDLQDLGRHQLKGLSAPVGAFGVAGEQALESRFEARAGPAIMPMVGRDQELALLLERWAQAKAGEGQGVLLVGEAGIGKSRISRAVLDAVAEEPHVRIRYQCSPYHGDSALWPVIQQLSQVARIAADELLETKLDKLEALLARARAGDAADAAPLISSLIGLDGEGRYGKLDLTPQARRVRTLEALVEQLLGLAAQQPVLLLLEDAHWIDPTTLELISRCLDRIVDAPVLLLLTSRPDQQPQLAAHPHVTRLSLNRLGRAGGAAIVTRLSGGQGADGRAGRALPAELIDAIITRTDGVPLFVEELTKAILETGEISIPASLHDSLMARLDRIPEVKEVAQIAACIGRSFDYPLLTAVARKPEPELIAALDQLAEVELIFPRGTPPDAHYTFKHALVQDAAYEALLKSTRQRLHARIAQVLEERFLEVAAGEPELLARHHTQAGNATRAIECWHEAGIRAARSSANVEAIGHLRKGLQVVADLADSKERDRSELRLRLALTAPLIATAGYAAAETVEAYQRARSLCDRLGDDEPLLPLLYGEWIQNIVGPADQSAGRSIAQRFLRLAEDRGDADAVLTGHRMVGLSMVLLGEFSDGMAHSDRAISLYDPEKHPMLAQSYGQDPWVASQSVGRAWSLWHLGYPAQADQAIQAALDRAHELQHTNSTAYALFFTAVVTESQRQDAELARRVAALLALSKEHQLALWLAWGQIFEGWLAVRSGRLADGLAAIEKGLHGSIAADSRFGQSYFLSLQARAFELAGRIEEALRTVDRALELLDETSERFCEAELHRVKGALMLADGSATNGAACFERAIAVARDQSARSLELRAATCLAGLWAEQGERQKALDLLAPVFDWFTEGFDTADLKDAKALLDDLG